MKHPGSNVPHAEVIDRKSRARPELRQHTERDRPPAAPVFCTFCETIGSVNEPQPILGQYPTALIPKILPWLKCERHEVLHVCSGALKPGDGIRVDIRPAAAPDILADGRALPLPDASMPAVMLDPPYTSQYARDLYGVTYPRPVHLLAEAARVVRPCGRICFVHYIIPNRPPGCRFIRAFGLITGGGFPIRAVTIFERDQECLHLPEPPHEQ